MKRRCRSYMKTQDWEIALKDLKQDPQFSYPHLRCYEFFFLAYEFSKELRLFLQLFVFRFFMEGQSKYLLWKFEASTL